MIDREMIESFIKFCSEQLDTDMMKYWDHGYYFQDTHLLLDAYEKYLVDGEESLVKDYGEEL